MVVIVNIMIMISVNKYNEDFEHNEAPGEFSGHKWSLQTFWKYLEKEVFFFSIITIFIFLMIILIVIMLMWWSSQQVFQICEKAGNTCPDYFPPPFFSHCSHCNSNFQIKMITRVTTQAGSRPGSTTWWPRRSSAATRTCSAPLTRRSSSPNFRSNPFSEWTEDKVLSQNGQLFLRTGNYFSEWTTISHNGQLESSSAGEIWLQLLQTIWCGCLSGQVGLCQKIYLWWFVYWPKQNVQLTISIIAMSDS